MVFEHPDGCILPEAQRPGCWSLPPGTDCRCRHLLRLRRVGGPSVPSTPEGKISAEVGTVPFWARPRLLL